MKFSFKPLSNKDCKILILGSLPGEISLEKGEYYAHPRNSFWKIMCDTFAKTYINNYDTRCELLLNNNIALWDIIYSAKREGSLDSSIKSATENNIELFLLSHNKIEKILLNGGKAASVYKRQCKDIKIPYLVLPSTSPANARLSYEEKRSIWQKELLG